MSQLIPTTKKTKDIFKIGGYFVYKTHGIGQLQNREILEVCDQKIENLVFYFAQDKMTIHVPINKIEELGIRALSSKEKIQKILESIKDDGCKSKGKWNKRAQEYSAKINSGELSKIAEVIRELTRDINESERSYSERIIYETAIQRLAEEYALVFDLDLKEAKDNIISLARNKMELKKVKSNKKPDETIKTEHLLPEGINDDDDFDFDDEEESKII